MPAPIATVLVVDDDPAVGKVIGAQLGQAGIHADYARSGQEALDLLARRPIDVMVTDLRMPGMDGMELLANAAAQWPEVPVVMMTAHGTVPLAVEAMKRGAADFVMKPFDREEFLFVVKKALAHARHAEPGPAVRPKSFIGDSPAIKDTYRLISRAAPGTATVLLRGESGTGKELAARAVHEQSPRASGPFVTLHCAALPDNLLESELFGSEKGAFTGAAARKPGRVEFAEGGTLFLDEVGEIALTVQVKLLRLIQEREFQRLGGNETHKVDVRFVAATHRNLEEMVHKGTFREDLFYRLNVVPLWLPALRDRPEDIAELAHHFCAVFAAANRRPAAALDPGAIEVLRRQRWPGNVRELQNFIERLVVLSEHDVIGAADVEAELARRPPQPSPATELAPAQPAAAAAPAAGESGTLLDAHRKTAEREALTTAIARAGGNRTLAARILGVSRRTLYNKLEEHGLL
jgi:two-component system, NtrC family, response regulator AtoC